MKNVWMLFHYELKKIWSRPLLWAAMAVCGAAFVFISPIPSYHWDQTFTAVDTEGNEITRLVTAEEQFRAEIEGSRVLSGQPMDEAFFQKARETVPDVGGPQLNTEAQRAYFYLIDSSYCGAFNQFSGLMDETAEGFYGVRQRWIEDSWNYGKEYMGQTDEDVAYWERMEARVEKPFLFQPVQGPSRLMEVLGLLTAVVPLLAGLCLCELFSQDRRYRTHSVVVSSRWGRGRLFLAKTLAGGVSAMLAVVMAAGAAVAASLALYGTWGWDGAIQLGLHTMTCCLPITMGQGILLLVGLLALYALVCGALVSAVSMWTGSGVAALAASVAVTAMCMVLSVYWHPSGVLAQIYDRLPFNFVGWLSLIRHDMTHLFGLRLDWLQSGTLLYLGIAAAFTALCWLGWRRQAVSGA